MKTYACHAYTTIDALTVAEDILRHAKGKTVHPTILHKLTDVRATHNVLDLASRTRFEEDDPLGAGLRAPMIAVRNGVAAIADLLRAHGALPDGGELAERARRTYAALFPQDTTFLKGKAALLDVHGRWMLDHAREDEHAALLEELGCAPSVKVTAKALSELRAARWAGTIGGAAEPEGPDVLAALGAATAALRAYADAVQAADVLEGATLQHELLGPLVHHRPAKRKPVAATAPAVVARSMTRTANDTKEDEAPPSRAA